jgi:hypothetical protein
MVQPKPPSAQIPLHWRNVSLNWCIVRLQWRKLSPWPLPCRGQRLCLREKCREIHPIRCKISASWCEILVFAARRRNVVLGGSTMSRHFYILARYSATSRQFLIMLAQYRAISAHFMGILRHYGCRSRQLKLLFALEVRGEELSRRVLRHFLPVTRTLGRSWRDIFLSCASVRRSCASFRYLPGPDVGLPHGGETLVQGGARLRAWEQTPSNGGEPLAPRWVPGFCGGPRHSPSGSNRAGELVGMGREQDGGDRCPSVGAHR